MARAMAAGGLGSVRALLSLDGFGSADALQASALRATLLQGVCLAAAAWDMGCFSLPDGLLDSWIGCIEALVDGASV